MLQQYPNEPSAPLAGRDLAPPAVPARVSVPEESVDLQGWLAVLHRRRWLMAVTFVVLFSLGMVHTLRQTPIYESTASILVTTNSVPRPDDNAVPSEVTQNRSVETQVAVLTSYALLREAYAKLDPAQQLQGFRTRDVPSWAVRAAPRKSTDVIDIVTQAYTPTAAAALANSVAQTYFTRDLADVREATRQARQYVEDNRGAINEQLAEVNKELATLKARTGMLNPEAQLTQTAQRISSLQSELDEANTQVSVNEQSLHELQRQLTTQDRSVVSGSTVTGNPRYASVVAGIDALQNERATLLQEYTPNSAEVQAIDARIAEQEQHLKAISSTIVAQESHVRNPLHEATLRDYAVALAGRTAAQARAHRLTTTMAEWQQRAKTLPEKERQYLELTQRQTQLKGTYDMLTTKNHNLLLSERILPNGRVVSVGAVINTPVKPRKTTDAVVYFLLSLICVGVLVRIVEWLDERVHDPETAEHLTGLPALGLIGEVPQHASSLLSDGVHYSPLLEQVRILRNNLSLTEAARDRRCLAVTSAATHEGKSMISTNLAISLAMDGKRVLLVDADMYRRSMISLSKNHDAPGLSEVLRGECQLENALQSTDIDGLTLLSSGKLPPNPVELLNSPAAVDLFAELSATYDRVILDCPPCAKFSDVQVIARHIDGLLFVVAGDQTERRGLQQAIGNLLRIGAPLIGLVMNRIDMHRRGYSYGSGYYDAYYSPAQPNLKALGKGK